MKYRICLTFLFTLLFGGLIAQSKAEENAVASKKWLEENAHKKGVVTHESGLQYKILKRGKGGHPDANATVTVHYEGRLISGKIFDSSWKRREPFEADLNNLIPAWKIGIPLMKKGATWEIYCPPDLAYGQRGAGTDIGPNEALIFKVKLIRFKD